MSEKVASTIPPETFSERLTAGKRTYFLDVKPTRTQQLYIKLTETLEQLDTDGNKSYSRNTIHIYPEDLAKLEALLKKGFDFIKSKK
jgi:hypothetical protein